MRGKIIVAFLMAYCFFLGEVSAELAARKRLRKQLGSKETHILNSALSELSRLGPKGKSFVKELSKLIRHKDYSVRIAAIRQAGVFGRDAAVAIKNLKFTMTDIPKYKRKPTYRPHQILSVHSESIAALGKIGYAARSTESAILRTLEDSANPLVVIEALALIGADSSATGFKLMRHYQKGDSSHQLPILRTLRLINVHSANLEKFLVKVAFSEEDNLEHRCLALQALGTNQCRSESTIIELEKLALLEPSDEMTGFEKATLATLQVNACLALSQLDDGQLVLPILEKRYELTKGGSGFDFFNCNDLVPGTYKVHNFGECRVGRTMRDLGQQLSCILLQTMINNYQSKRRSVPILLFTSYINTTSDPYLRGQLLNSIGALESSKALVEIVASTMSAGELSDYGRERLIKGLERSSGQSRSYEKILKRLMKRKKEPFKKLAGQVLKELENYQAPEAQKDEPKAAGSGQKEPVTKPDTGESDSTPPMDPDLPPP